MHSTHPCQTKNWESFKNVSSHCRGKHLSRFSRDSTEGLHDQYFGQYILTTFTWKDYIMQQGQALKKCITLYSVSCFLHHQELFLQLSFV